MGPMSRAFVASIERCAADEGIPLIKFKAGERKVDIAKKYLAAFTGEEGVFLIGKAQEKTRVVRTEKRRNPTTGQTYPWLVMSTAMVNQYYFYCVDRDFGPFFIKIGSYFPYNGRRSGPTSSATLARPPSGCKPCVRSWRRTPYGASLRRRTSWRS